MQKRNTFRTIQKKGHSTKGRGSNLQFGWTIKKECTLPPLQEAARQINFVRIGYICRRYRGSELSSTAHEGAGQGPGTVSGFAAQIDKIYFQLKTNITSEGEGVEGDRYTGGEERGFGREWVALSFLSCGTDIQHFIGSVFYV